MRITYTDFMVQEGQPVRLSQLPTAVKPFYDSKEHYRECLEEHVEQLSAQQEMLYASGQYALLLVFQALDAAGKDGAISHVLSGVNPQGCQVTSFKQPSATELAHDFLWRCNQALPERGRIGIFNRSYYEEVLVVRVHPEILQGQRLPRELVDLERIWDERYHSINALEKHLYRNGTRIVKFYLHVSKDEQRRRFLDRIDEPEKNWKFSPADVQERKFWDAYMQAYEACLGATSTSHAPWFVIPADDKENARLIISQIVVDTLKELHLAFPEVSPERRAELLEIRKALEE